MREAYHPESGQLIDAYKYSIYARNCEGQPRPAICPHCKQGLTPVAVHSPNTAGHFAHQKNSGFCPTKLTSAGPYKGLHPRRPDPEAARRMRKLFLQNWQKHFSRLDWLAKALSMDEFFNLIKLAAQERIWEYAYLEEYQLPYVLATLADFPPHLSYRKSGVPVRQRWFRFWFDSSVQRFDDLWIDRHEPVEFWRVWYALPPGRRKPNAEDLVGSYIEPMSAGFLQTESRLPEFVVARVEEWLDANFRAE